MLNRLLKISIAALTLFASSSIDPAQAAPTTTLVPIAISPEAIAADPALANCQSFDLRVHIDPGFTWSATGFNIRLSGGTFYNPPIGNEGPLPHLWALFPQLRYDTFITHAAVPDDPTTFAMPLIHGGYPFPPVTPYIFNDVEMSLIYSWTPAQSSGPGMFTVARLTITNGAHGVLNGESHQYDVASTGTQILPFSLTIPEPLMASPAVTLAAWFMVRRRPLASGRGSR